MSIFVIPSTEGDRVILNDMKNKAIIFRLALMLGFFFSSQAFGQESVEATTHNKVELTVTGMTCGGCASKQKAFLEGIDGVTAAKVDYAANKAVVSYDAEKTSEASILASLGDSPFPAKGAATEAAAEKAAHPSCTGSKKGKKNCDPAQCHGKKKTEL